MKFGTNEIQKVYLGTTELNSLYFGSNQVYTKGGFDEYTVAVFHLDLGDTHTDNAVSSSTTTLVVGNASTSNSYTTNTSPKFGDRCAGFGSAAPTTHRSMFSDLPDNFATNDFTWDWWQKCTTRVDTYNKACYFGLRGSYFRYLGLTATEVYLGGNTTSVGAGTVIKSGITTTDDLGTAIWHHLAIEKYNDNLYFYVDGEMCASRTAFTPTHFSRYGMTSDTYGETRFDEIRLSSTARYHGQNFTPPTQPYS